MKLYTEEQVRNAIAMGYDWCHQKHIPSDYMINTFIEQLIPIKLPSDDEIDESKFPSNSPEQELYNDGYEQGAKWMRDQITNTKEK